MAYDYVIIGGGSAGCVLAARLSEDPDVKVLLLEAGGSDRHPLFHMPAGFAKMTKGIASWGWSTVPQQHMNGRVLRYTQAKVIGGGSSINAQLYTRGNAQDYDDWAADGLHRLGLSRRAALFQARRGQPALRQRRTTATAARSACRSRSRRCRSARPSSAPAQEFGIPYNPTSTARQQDGIGYYQLTQRNAPPLLGRRSPICSRPGSRANLTVRTGRRVLRIVVEKGRAVGVEISTGRHEIIRAEARGDRLLGRHRLAALLHAVGHRPGRSPEVRSASSSCTTCRASARTCRTTSISSSSAECTGDHTYDSYAKPHRTLWAGAAVSAVPQGPGRLHACSRPAASGTPTRTPAPPDIQFHSASAPASRRASRS